MKMTKKGGEKGEKGIGEEEGRRNRKRARKKEVGGGRGGWKKRNEEEKKERGGRGGRGRKRKRERKRRSENKRRNALLTHEWSMGGFFPLTWCGPQRWPWKLWLSILLLYCFAFTSQSMGLHTVCLTSWWLQITRRPYPIWFPVFNPTLATWLVLNDTASLQGDTIYQLSAETLSYLRKGGGHGRPQNHVSGESGRTGSQKICCGSHKCPPCHFAHKQLTRIKC